MDKEQYADKENKGFPYDDVAQSPTCSYALRAVRNCSFSIGIYR